MKNNKFLIVLIPLFWIQTLGEKLPFNYGPHFQDSLLPLGENIQRKLDLTKSPLYFLNKMYSSLYVDVNGALWLGDWNFTTESVPSTFPVSVGQQMVACYWARSNSNLNPHTKVYYRNSKDSLSWSKANSYLQKALGSIATFDYTSPSKLLIIATWINITYAGGSDSTPTNTFQCALASDGTNSYTMFAFQSLGWSQNPADNSPAAVGVDDGTLNSGNSSLILPYSWTSQVSTLNNETNFKSKTKYNGPQGWWMVTECATPSPPLYNITPGTPYKQCFADGDPHYYTFDGLSVDFSFGITPTGFPYQLPTSNQPQGAVIMMATTDCKKTSWPPLSIIAEIEKVQPTAPVSPSPVTGVHGVIITFYWNSRGTNKEGDIVLEIRDKMLQIGQESYTSYQCPYDLCPIYTFAVGPYNGGFQVTTNFGLTVIYADWNLKIIVPYLDDLKENIFGYCGNLDGNSDNDNYCWNSNEQNYDTYQNCWTAKYLTNNNNQNNPGYFKCPYDQISLFKSHSSQKLTATNNTFGTYYAIEQCETIMEFCPLLPSSIVNTFYESCVADMSISNNDKSMFCNIFEGLAAECMAYLHLDFLDWRFEYNCSMECPENSKYLPGGPPCLPTCDDPFASTFCQTSNIDGCFPSPGYLYQDGAFITPDDCFGCLDNYGNTVPTKSWWYTNQCTQHCYCNGNEAACLPVAGCDPNATCIAVGLQFQCICNDGYYGDGSYCTTENLCSPNNRCQNGATCQYHSNTYYTCLCPIGYTGQYCETQVNHCLPSVCGSNGKCINHAVGFECQCNQGYTGSRCQYESNWCASFPCVNLATCISDNDDYQCLCMPGYTGRNCEYNASEISTTTLRTTMYPTTMTTSYLVCNTSTTGATFKTTSAQTIPSGSTTTVSRFTRTSTSNRPPATSSSTTKPPTITTTMRKSSSRPPATSSSATKPSTTTSTTRKATQSARSTTQTNTPKQTYSTAFYTGNVASTSASVSEISTTTIVSTTIVSTTATMPSSYGGFSVTNGGCGGVLFFIFVSIFCLKLI